VFNGPTVVPTLLVETVPFQPSEPVPPLAVQALAPLDIQLRSTEPPAVIVVGVAMKLTMLAAGAAAVTVTVAALVALVPPAPVQVNVKI
jgi:hypothetical protein